MGDARKTPDEHAGTPLHGVSLYDVCKLRAEIARFCATPAEVATFMAAQFVPATLAFGLLDWAVFLSGSTCIHEWQIALRAVAAVACQVVCARVHMRSYARNHGIGASGPHWWIWNVQMCMGAGIVAAFTLAIYGAISALFANAGDRAHALLVVGLIFLYAIVLSAFSFGAVRLQRIYTRRIQDDYVLSKSHACARHKICLCECAACLAPADGEQSGDE